ncbi:uncharacterized protein LOC100210352 [Hydra vulgaris]|uniref:Uncharacterized protein LOC100210352 n=1 Tax=Hydra vulgaris TaxID=6087 RepID=A0ABM4BG47_HYDVU
MSSSLCCPIGSEKALSINYESIGRVLNLDGLDIYEVGCGDKVIIVYYDIFGFNGGRIRLICDQIANEGFLVVLIDIFHGDMWPADAPLDAELFKWVSQFTWEKIKADTDKVFKHLEKSDIKSYGSLGFCFGAWPVFHLSQNKIMKCGANVHPSVHVGSLHGETPEQLARLLECPQLIYAANNDLPTYNDGGEVKQILQEKFGDQNDIQLFPDMVHGWVPRGDCNDERVARDVKLAMDGIIKFFKKNL